MKMLRFVATAATAVFLAFSGGPVWAQDLVPGSPVSESRAIRDAGSASRAIRIAKSKGWDVYQVHAPQYHVRSNGSDGSYAVGTLPAGTWMARTPEGVRIVGYTRRGRWHGCGNLTNVRPPRVVYHRYRERVVERPRTVYVYVFGPTVYPTAPMPQPQVTYCPRPPVYATWSQVDVRYKHAAAGGGINLFSSAKGGSSSNLNGNWSANDLSAQGGTVGDVTNQNNNSADASAQNNNPVNTVVNTGSGNAGGSATGTANH